MGVIISYKYPITFLLSILSFEMLNWLTIATYIKESFDRLTLVMNIHRYVHICKDATTLKSIILFKYVSVEDTKSYSNCKSLTFHLKHVIFVTLSIYCISFMGSKWPLVGDVKLCLQQKCQCVDYDENNGVHI